MFFGGARGGGKTDGVLGKWAIKEQDYGRHFNAIGFRRSTVSFEDAIERSKEIYGPLGGKYIGSPVPHWKMPHGGRISFRYLESVADAGEYQGRNVTDAWVEEAGQYETPAAIDRLFGVLRSAHSVPVQLILTANPGGPGQHWILDRYKLHPFPRKPRLIQRALPTGETHTIAVIPSRITDNKILVTQDPGYIGRLHLVGSAQLVKAWLEGDWTAIEGAFFDCWSEKNIIPPFTVPVDWLRFRSADWGSYSPFSVGWWAVVQDDFRFPGELDGRGNGGARSRTLPRGALVRYREWYGVGGGKAKLTAEQVGEGIAQRERDDPALSYGVLDPSAFNEDGGPSIAERINTALIGKKCIAFRPADNSKVPRVSGTDRGGAMGGWDAMRQRIIGQDGRPMIYCFETCTDSIRTIPTLQHDEARAEDVSGEDHAADEWRYACMSRPWLHAKPEPQEVKDGWRTYEDDTHESFKTI